MIVVNPDSSIQLTESYHMIEGQSCVNDVLITVTNFPDADVNKSVILHEDLTQMFYRNQSVWMIIVMRPLLVIGSCYFIYMWMLLETETDSDRH